MRNLLRVCQTWGTTILCIFSMNTLQAQQTIELPLWPDGAPNDNGITAQESMDTHGHLHNISRATLTVYLPMESKGKAVMACPGGGYAMVASQHEGHSFSTWMNQQDIVYAVLKYRLPNGHHEIPLSDAHQAIRVLRQHASEWGIEKIGVMGFSAGGHLASTVATHFTTDTRPDFQILFYPVVTFQKGLTHKGTRNALLGKEQTEELVEHYSNEKQVNAQTPPAFIVHCSDDRAVPVANSLLYYQALVSNKVPATLHCYSKGGHGWGFNEKFPYKAQWMDELSHWLKDL